MKAVIEQEKCCFFWHNWQWVKHVGKVNYFQCMNCPAKKAETSEPKPRVRWGWLSGITKSLYQSPKVRPEDNTEQRTDQCDTCPESLATCNNLEKSFEPEGTVWKCTKPKNPEWCAKKTPCDCIGFDGNEESCQNLVGHGGACVYYLKQSERGENNVSE
ncbi:MAG: hypothetical protein KAS30_01775 [Candidatus Diapherotrites archaeon]|nr:hypothetical protein [Candidatus Diapherotrites archaeon]